MLSVLLLSLHNGKPGPESERLHILCTDGPYYWSYHISHETDHENKDVAFFGGRWEMLEDGLDLEKWWFDKINEEIQKLFDIPSPPASLLENLGIEGTVVVRDEATAWTLLKKEMFTEDCWKKLEN